MKETTFMFGAGSALVGTLTTPDGTSTPRHGFAAILFNAGVIPRVGPNRLNVRLARALAASGFPVLRFDLSGRGDSAPAPGMESFEKQAITDLRAAMDTLSERLRVQRFLIMGICSGAENAYHTALVDERIVGISLMDPYHYLTWRTHFNRYRQRAKERGGILKAGAAWIGLRISRLLGRKRPAQDWAEPDFGSIRPPAAEYAANLRKLLDRGVAIDILYSGGFIESYNYANQFRDVFGPFGIMQRLQYEFRPDFDHTISAASMQRELVTRTCNWFDAAHRRTSAAR